MRDVHAADLPPSIALTVDVAPSRRLRALLLVLALAHCGAAGLMLSPAQNLAWPWLLAASCGAAAALCTGAALQPLNVRRIDISKAGALHLTVQRKQPLAGHAVRLLPGSLLWGRLLVLRFGSAAGAAFVARTVLVFPDSMGPESFRALAVAMRAIARRGEADEAKKIL